MELPSVINAETDFDVASNYSHYSNVTVTITCLPGYEWALYETNQTVECTEGGWNMTGISDCLLGEPVKGFRGSVEKFGGDRAWNIVSLLRQILNIAKSSRIIYLMDTE